MRINIPTTQINLFVYHWAFAFADDHGALEMQVISVRELERLEISVQQFNGRATGGKALLHTGKNGGIDCAAVRIYKLLLSLVGTAMCPAAGQTRIQTSCSKTSTQAH